MHTFTNDDLRREREARLLRLLEMRAPSTVIEQECRLVLPSYHGGHVRAILWMVREFISSKWSWQIDNFQFNLHNLARKVGIHIKFRDTDLDLDCWVCEPTIDFEDIDAYYFERKADRD